MAYKTVLTTSTPNMLSMSSVMRVTSMIFTPRGWRPNRPMTAHNSDASVT